MPKVSEFSYLVSAYKDNDPEIDERFIRECGGNLDLEINHTQAFNACDRALLNGGKPIPPSVGHRTNSFPPRLKVPDFIKRLARESKE